MDDDWAVTNGWMRLGIPKMTVDHVVEPTWILNCRPKIDEPDETCWDKEDLGVRLAYDAARTEVADISMMCPLYKGREQFVTYPVLRTHKSGITKLEHLSHGEIDMAFACPLYHGPEKSFKYSARSLTHVACDSTPHEVKKPWHSNSAIYKGFQGNRDRRKGIPLSQMDHPVSACDTWLRHRGIEPDMKVAVAKRHQERLDEAAATPLTSEETSQLRTRQAPFQDKFWDRPTYKAHQYWTTYERIGDHFKLVVHPDGDDVSEGMLGGAESFEPMRVAVAA